MKQILDAAALDRAIRRLSHEMEERNDGLRDVPLIGNRTRGMVVAERIRDFFRESEGIELPLGVLDITLYRDDILSCDALVKGTEIDFGIEGKTLVLCDDVLYTGRTVRAAISARISRTAAILERQTLPTTRLISTIFSNAAARWATSR